MCLETTLKVIISRDFVVLLFLDTIPPILAQFNQAERRRCKARREKCTRKKLAWASYVKLPKMKSVPVFTKV